MGAGADAKRRSEPRAGAADTRLPTVIPDLVVHRRGFRGVEHNLLVVEVKKNDERNDEAEIDDAARSGNGGSVESILDIQRQFEYGHAVYLDLVLTSGGFKPRWKWAELGKSASPATLNWEDVYKKKALDALDARGRAEDIRRYGASDPLDHFGKYPDRGGEDG